jgi:hypothetical protein
MREVNYVFEKAARERGFYSDELIDDIVEAGTLQHRDDVPEEIKRTFVTAHDISPYWHMRMQSAFQRHCDSSISKTINFPREAAVEDVRQIYELAIDENVKGVTVYRDGCREMQPMALKDSVKGGTPEAQAAPVLRTRTSESGDEELNPIKLPEIMSCLRIRQMTPFGNMHVKVSVDPVSGREREVFAQLGKGGDVANSRVESLRSDQGRTHHVAGGWARDRLAALRGGQGGGRSARAVARRCRTRPGEDRLRPAQAGRDQGALSCSTAQRLAVQAQVPGLHGRLGLRRGLREVLRVRFQPVLRTTAAVPSPT